MLEHERKAIELTPAAKAGEEGLPPQEELDRLAQEVAQRQSKHDGGSAGRSVLDRALMALELGLAGRAGSAPGVGRRRLRPSWHGPGTGSAPEDGPGQRGTGLDRPRAAGGIGASTTGCEHSSAGGVRRLCPRRGRMRGAGPSLCTGRAGRRRAQADSGGTGDPAGPGRAGRTARGRGGASPDPAGARLARFE